MKKHIAFMISCIMVAVCFSFPVFAVTAPGKTITTSYNYGDVSINVSVNGGPSETLVVGTSHYEHRFSVTVTNKTNTFQVASTSMIGLKLYSGNNFTFDSTGTDSSGNVYNLGSWAAEVSSYSDNMTVPTVQFYNSNSENFKGCVYISFKDADLLVLNPNETRTYDFTIDFTCYLPASAVPFNGDIQYSYFTYSGNVSIYNKPSSFTSNTIEQFIENDSFPNSAIAWLIASYEQGIVDQEKYDHIISILMSKPDNILFGSNASGIFYQNYSITLQNSPFITQFYGYIGNPIPVDTDFNRNGIDFSDVSLNESSIYVVPTYIEYRITNSSNNTYSSTASFHKFTLPLNNINLKQGYYYGSDYEVIISDGISLLNLGHDLYFKVDDNVGNLEIISSGAYYRCVIRYNRYFVVCKTDNNITRPTLIYTDNFKPSNYFLPTYSIYNQNIPSFINKILSDIRDLLIANTSKNDQISDESGTVSDTESQIHAQEQQWYSDNEAAIEATGLSNFEFSSGELDGLTQLRLQFSQVWGALGDWTLVYIFVLSLSLATFILRHRPTTKAQQRMADSAKYRQDVRNRWATQDARASNNSSGFSDEIWRRAGYR